MIKYGITLLLICVTGDLWGVRYSMRKILSSKTDSLRKYRQKRDFRNTREPRGKVAKKEKNIFVVQQHNASHLHYDFRLAIDGVLKSWAVPKGLPRRAGIKRLAIQTEDHPMAYAKFEGTITEGNYGAGTVTIWDRGTYANEKSIGMSQALEAGSLEFSLNGSTLKGVYVLVRMRNSPKNWLILKKRALKVQL